MIKQEIIVTSEFSTSQENFAKRFFVEKEIEKEKFASSRNSGLLKSLTKGREALNWVSS